MLEHHFDHSEKSERARDHAREGHEAKRKGGAIYQHTGPEPRQFPDRVAASALLPFHVTHPRCAGVLRDLKNQPIHIWIRSARLGDLLSDETTDAAKTRRIT